MIFFLHIPKTGGQTLATRIAAAFPPGRAYILQSNIRTGEELAQLCAEYDFIEGHPAAAVLANPPDGLDLMTAVRDPVEQIISHYRHIRRAPVNDLNKAANTLTPIAFMERFSAVMFNFQARTLVKTFVAPNALTLAAGEEAWMLRHLEAAIGALRWFIPTEAIDLFGPLWSLETGRTLPLPTAQVNLATPDSVDISRLRDWLRERPERFAVDSLLWSRARSTFAVWSHEVLSGGDRIPPGDSPMCASRDGKAGIWLGTGWHPPARRGDGVVEWWSGPDFMSGIRVQRAGRQTMYFEVAATLGVHIHRLRVSHPASNRILPSTVRVIPDTSIAEVCVQLDGLGEDERLLLYGPESIQVLPDVPLALESPRRGFATQNWRLE